MKMRSFGMGGDFNGRGQKMDSRLRGNDGLGAWGSYLHGN